MNTQTTFVVGEADTRRGADLPRLDERRSKRMTADRSSVSPRVGPDAMERCDVPPSGWWCSRPLGHDGPCAARPIVMTTCVDQERYAEIWNEGYEAAMAQHLADDPSAAEDWLAERDKRRDEELRANPAAALRLLFPDGAGGVDAAGLAKALGWEHFVQPSRLFVDERGRARASGSTVRVQDRLRSPWRTVEGDR